MILLGEQDTGILIQENYRPCNTKDVTVVYSSRYSHVSQTSLEQSFGWSSNNEAIGGD